ncbi:MAG: hypothetical protein IJU44_11220 [Kiritimatiellae bacterium]|nr:hypothetical protein [Kiritimatiellia bacterium]
MTNHSSSPSVHGGRGRAISSLLSLLSLKSLFLIALAFAAPARATEFAAGDGSAASPCEIGTAAELAKFRDIANGANGETLNCAACARLTADIDEWLRGV